uniref:Uncharacterized protein n=1 Tax=Kalanchoe fedtschenkoi TaxID=63787 RepID=A0A7N0TT30_KALFE
MAAFEDFEPIFGEARAVSSDSSLVLPRKFLFRVYAPDPGHLATCVTDFQSTTWVARRSIKQLDDLRENTGIVGSWPEFLDYLASSLKSEDVKLILDRRRKSDGSISAKLVAQKSKGMPLISITLSKLLDADAVEAIANFSLELFKAYKCMKESIAKEEGSSHQSKKAIPEGQNEGARNQRELNSHQRTKYNVHNDDEKLISLSTSGFEMSPEKVTARSKVTNPVVPAYRRAKKRGAILQDSEDEEDQDN